MINLIMKRRRGREVVLSAHANFGYIQFKMEELE